jgi:hypothetical protein
MSIIHKIIVASALLGLATSASATTPTATSAQWKDIRTIYRTFGTCGDPEREEVCAIAHGLMKKLERQGFCFYKRLLVGKLAWHGPEADRVQLWPEGGKQCYALHDPTH